MTNEKGRHIYLNGTAHYRILESTANSSWSWTSVWRGNPSTNPHNFQNNSIKTARYTIFSFLPKQLYFQFSKFANMYFLFISLLQLVPNWSPTGQYTTILPLTLFVAISMAREAYDDYKRHLHDRRENNSLIEKMKLVPYSRRQSFSQAFSSRFSIGSRRPSSTSPEMQVSWEKVSWDSLRVGDIIHLHDKEPIPADVLILSASNPNGICYIETANLDGETNLKMRQALNCTHSLINMNSSILPSLKGNIGAEAPNGNLYTFEGVCEFESPGSSQKIPLSIDQLLLRGSTVRNTKEIFGLVVYTGEETRIRKNANRSTKAKRPTLEKLTNRIVLWMFTIVISLAILNTIASMIWESTENSPKDRLWYLGGQFRNIAETFFSSIILYNAFIPLSLYVTMEMIKLVQVLLMNNDLDMYDEERDIPAQSFTSSLNEELGQVQYLFTDKTGTLTENIMEFQKFSVIGQSFSMKKPERKNSESFYDTLPASVKVKGDLSPKHITLHEEHVVPLLHKLKDNQLASVIPSSSSENGNNPSSFQKVYGFLESIALCHSVVPEVSETEKIQYQLVDPTLPSISTWQNLLYQASSPDEVALINAAREMRFVLTQRDPQYVHLNILGSPDNEKYEILHIIPFSSSRKRMSVIYRTSKNEIVLFCKGADSVILERSVPKSNMSKEEEHELEKMISHVDAYATEGLRTLLYAKRILNPEEYESWAARYEEAAASLENRTEKMEQVGKEIETNLTILGATAIEDRLQALVPETIEKLRRAGIKVWMLTGDKKETAVNIGYTCRLIKDDSEVIVISGNNPREVQVSVERALDYMKDKQVKEEMSPTSEHQHVVLVLEGSVLSIIEKARDVANRSENENQKHSLDKRTLLRRFLCLGMLTDGVICCRFSPSQKALIVNQVKKVANCMAENNLNIWQIAQEYPSESNRRGVLERIRRLFTYPTSMSGVTLAIGDGANDIPMIQSASVGIGITGREGLAAARASDYAIAQFRFLQKLLLVHGRWNYVRMCLFILGTFYRCIVFYSCQAFFQFWTGYSGTSLFEQWTLALYSILFSSFPVLVVGMFEQDLKKSTLLGAPELYRIGQHHRLFNFRIFWIWIFNGIWHMIISCFIPFLCYQAFIGSDPLVTQTDSGMAATSKINEIFLSDVSGPFQESSLYMIGTVVYTNVIFLITLKIGYLESKHWTVMNHAAAAASLGFWFLFQYTYSEYFWPALPVFGYDSNGLWFSLKNIQVQYWSMIFLSISLAMGLVDFAAKSFRWAFRTGIQLSDGTWVDPRIGEPCVLEKNDHARSAGVVDHDHDRDNLEKKRQALAGQVAEYLKSVEVPVEDMAFSVEWWQIWERFHYE